MSQTTTEVPLLAPAPAAPPAVNGRANGHVAAPPAPHDPHAVDEAPPRPPSFLRLALLGLLAVGVFVALTVVGLRARSRLQSDRDAVTVARPDKPRVLVVTAEKAPARVEQVLPASAAPLLDTAVYARTSGYLKRWLVDIGDIVKEGQLLAEIETPEVDAQLLQARAALIESRATLERNRASANLARVNLDRAQRLVKTSALSQQEYDESDAAYRVADASVRVSEATIAANEANVRRLEDLQRFQKVTAPFAGSVTNRTYDPGALIVADNAAARELFHLSRMDTLRVYADVPQTFATTVHPGLPAQVFRREVPGREFPGTVTRTTGAVDPRTRTLRVEVDVPNPDRALPGPLRAVLPAHFLGAAELPKADRALLPGMFLQVRFRLDAPAAVVKVPGAVVITRGDGTKVAVVDDEGKIRYRAVQVGRDFGQTIEVTGGLTGGERVVVRPGDDLPDGTAVEAVTGAPQ